MSTANFEKLQDEELDNLFCSKCSYITNFITIFRHDNYSCLVMDFCEVSFFYFYDLGIKFFLLKALIL